MGARAWVRRGAAALAALALSFLAGALLVWGLVNDLPAVLVLVVSMGLVTAATTVGSLWSAWPVGLLVAAPPVSVIYWVAVIEEGDPQGPIAGFFITFLALAVSAGAWCLLFFTRRQHGLGAR